MERQFEHFFLQWDVKSWSKAINYWEKKMDWTSVKSAIELGGRDGGLSLWLALKSIDTICSDLHNPQQDAKKTHDSFKVSNKIVYEAVDATQIPYKDHFDVIVFKSIIGGIGYGNNLERQEQAFNSMYQALKPGGYLLFAENLVASPLHQWLRRKYTDWGSDWRYMNLKELNKCLGVFEHHEIKTNGFLGVLGRSEKQKSILATMDRYLFDHVMPKSWHYIAYGIARK